ncbi:alpha/beta hydrolase-fold protein [Lewinella sp. W8]|uniref:carboxylesterase family protein n=1 Tax=Lewinella sp. W8 TaxID=2528208 RepID=UPI0010677735|nr:alpha/beta hydrolase-fold protein [Lewinella sp. W8]MTB52117.1 alpha/beta hydrolase [Lewinella sp. W8]
MRIILLLLLCGLSFPAHAQFERGFVDLGRDSMHYLLAYPEGFGDGEELWPLVLFLHGGGEGGNDLELVKKNGIPKHVAAGEKFPFVLLAPQNKYQRGFWDIVGLHHLLDEITRDTRIDPDRIYLTGLSRGGLGAWMTAMHDPGRFAALVPVCGAVPASYDIWVPENLPIWVFHGTDDDLIHPSESVNMVENLRRKKMSPPPKLTLYEGVGHNSWERAYADPELYRWMLAQRRRGTK